MKAKYLLLIICLFSSSLIYAQNNTFNNLFDKYENEDDVTVISISKAMFKMIPGNINTGNVDIKNIVPKIESMLIITSEKAGIKEKMNSEFKSLINQNKNYEELMRVKSGKSNITFNAKKKGDIINELVMLINDEKDFVAIQISGNFTLDDIQKIAKDTETQ
jgi:vacuolar-type H+-ATPase subunit F/Vma7